MRLVEEAHAFLIHSCLRSGRVRSKATWKRYGRDLYDFFGFIITNDFDWKQDQVRGSLHPAESYRDWALSQCGLSRRNVNARLRTVLRFYKWAVCEQLVRRLRHPAPFKILAHAARNVFGTAAERLDEADVFNASGGASSLFPAEG